MDKPNLTSSDHLISISDHPVLSNIVNVVNRQVWHVRSNIFSLLPASSWKTLATRRLNLEHQCCLPAIPQPSTVLPSGRISHTKTKRVEVPLNGSKSTTVHCNQMRAFYRLTQGVWYTRTRLLHGHISLFEVNLCTVLYQNLPVSDCG